LADQAWQQQQIYQEVQAATSAAWLLAVLLQLWYMAVVAAVVAWA
jgi:hypothetical protein